MAVNVTLNGVVYAIPTTGNVGWGAVLTSFLQAAASYLTTVAASINGVLAGTQALTQPTVVAPALLNSWVNFGGGYTAAGYWKDSLGNVHLQGLVKDGSLTAVPLFTLPAGYRPALAHTFVLASSPGGDFGVCEVLANGNVVYTAGQNSSFSLSGITFRAA